MVVGCNRSLTAALGSHSCCALLSGAHTTSRGATLLEASSSSSLALLFPHFLSLSSRAHCHRHHHHHHHCRRRLRREWECVLRRLSPPRSRARRLGRAGHALDFVSTAPQTFPAARFARPTGLYFFFVIFFLFAQIIHKLLLRFKRERLEPHFLLLVPPPSLGVPHLWCPCRGLLLPVLCSLTAALADAAPRVLSLPLCLFPSSSLSFFASLRASRTCFSFFCAQTWTRSSGFCRRETRSPVKLRGCCRPSAGEQLRIFGMVHGGRVRACACVCACARVCEGWRMALSAHMPAAFTFRRNIRDDRTIMGMLSLRQSDAAAVRRRRRRRERRWWRSCCGYCS